MRVKLLSFQFEATGPTRWRSERIDFAQDFTLMMGDNGTGKTPMMWGMAYAFGYPVELAPDVRANTDYATIELSIGNRHITLKRRVSDEFWISVSIDGSEQTLTSEREFSDQFFALLGLSPVAVTGTRGTGVRPYLSQFFPLFWASQSRGWTDLYQPLTSQSFIRDQREEMTRLLLSLPPRHPFDRSRAYIEKKKELETVDHLIEIRKDGVRKYEIELGELATTNAATLHGDKQKVKLLLESTRERLSASKKNTAAYDETIEVQRSNCFSIEREISDVSGTLSGMEIAYRELEGETEILESNELATDEFRKFCGTQNCKLFESAKLSYGKRLLYLKDQLKDLQGTSNSMTRQRDELASKLNLAKQELKGLEESREKARKELGIQEILTELEDLGRQYSELDQKHHRLRNFEEIKKSFVDKIIERTSLEEMVKSLKPGARRDDGSVSDMVSKFTTAFEKWVRILKTPNVREVSADDSFRLTINGERFTLDSYQDGSTRARIVLAYFATLLEVGTLDEQKHPGFILMDTPRQQELNMNDLRDYFVAMRALMHERGSQVVIACKDPIFESTTSDKIYNPVFAFGQERRYLGIP